MTRAFDAGRVPVTTTSEQARAHFERGRTAAHHDRFALARKAMFERYAALAPDEPRAHDSLGLLCLREGRHADAVRAFEQALARDPRFDESRVNLERARAAQADAEGLRPADTTEGGA